MGGRSSFTIGNSRFVDVYSPERQTWREMKNGCVMVIGDGSRSAGEEAVLYGVEEQEEARMVQSRCISR